MEEVTLLYQKLHNHMVEIINYYETNDIWYRIQVTGDGTREFITITTDGYEVYSVLVKYILAFPVVVFSN